MKLSRAVFFFLHEIDWYSRVRRCESVSVGVEGGAKQENRESYGVELTGAQDF